MFPKTEHLINKILLLIILLFLLGCQLNQSKNKHGIVFLKNRSDKLLVNKSNINDVINIIGHPHSKSSSNELSWIYIERVFEKGKFHKLGKNVLKENNILVLNFNKYGILEDKKFLDKNDLNKISFSQEITTNDLAKKSFVEKFLNSIKSKIYSNR